MFESAELGHEVPDAQYHKESADLRAKLLDTQYELLKDGSFPVIVLVNGVDGAGKGETVNLFNEWMDPRHIRSHAFGPLTDVEVARPPMWRFWHVLPPRGRIGILFGSWYTDPIVSHVIGHTDDARLTMEIDRIRRFERMLTDESALIVKLWFHLSKKRQKKRLEALASHKNTAWRVSKTDWKNHKHYDEYRGVTERVLRETSTGEAPWIVIDGWDANYRSLAAGRTLLGAMRARLDAKKAAPKRSVIKTRGVIKNPEPLGSVDTSGILRNLPFDRSWYGRVLVERVEGFAKEDAWKRAYSEINDFEEQLSEHGIVVVKLWLAITKDEQLRRFKEREKLRFKNFKITAEDWRNRDKWDDYIVAASDMIDRTSTSHAPWTVVEANDKHLARVRCIEAVCERIEATLEK
jgi:polyphosphate kinase 2 (PPK2 family)